MNYPILEAKVQRGFELMFSMDFVSSMGLNEVLLFGLCAKEWTQIA